MKILGKDIVIRLVDDSDSMKEITDLLHLAYRTLAEMGFRYNATHQSEEVTRRRFDRGEGYVVLKREKLIGTITMYYPRKGDGPRWYERPDVAKFGQFAVEPDLQKRGIGSAMLEFIEERAIETGAVELALDTAEGADNLIKFYMKRGYRFIEYADWESPNYRSVIMSKTLQK